MHVIFGVSAIAMLVTTVAMLAFDHYREWKPVQRKFRDIESWYSKARISEQDTDAFRQQERALEEELAKQQAQVPPQELIDRFLAEARSLVPGQVDSRARHDEATRRGAGPLFQRRGSHARNGSASPGSRTVRRTVPASSSRCWRRRPWRLSVTAADFRDRTRESTPPRTPVARNWRRACRESAGPRPPPAGPEA